MKTEGGLFQPVQDTLSVPGQQDSQHVCSVVLKYFKIKERLFGYVWAPPWNVITSIYSSAVLQHTFLELWWYSQLHPLKISFIFLQNDKFWQLTVDCWRVNFTTRLKKYSVCRGKLIMVWRKWDDRKNGRKRRLMRKEKRKRADFVMCVTLSSLCPCRFRYRKSLGDFSGQLKNTFGILSLFLLSISFLHLLSVFLLLQPRFPHSFRELMIQSFRILLLEQIRGGRAFSWRALSWL